jgi:competence protein ComFB
MSAAREKPVNLVKLIAEEMLASVMKKLEIEDTQENREDILALTLNALPTKYVTTDGGKQYAQLVEVYRIQYEADVLSNLTRAGLKVKAKPRARSKEKAEGVL